MSSFSEQNERYRPAGESALQKYMAGCGAPKLLNDSMSYSLFAGGKRLRPCMALAACEMLGGNIGRALPFACALEMIHTYSLIHDDLPCMDDDDFRRGKPSNHKVYGEANAVLAGDGLLSLAFEVMAKALQSDSTPEAINALRAVAAGVGVAGMVAGQSADLAAEKSQDASAETLQYIQLHKTAAMIRSAVLAGGCIAGASERELAALGKFGRLYGLLFQMTDDILDIEGSFDEMGKTLGKDQAENKLTWPALAGLDKAKALAKETAEAACGALEIFGGGAAYFCELTELTCERKS